MVEDLLVEHSEFFRAACRNEWKEATSRVIKLPDVDPDVFHNYLYWVHREKLHPTLEIRSFETDEPQIDGDTAAGLNHVLAQLWIFADRVADSLLRNTVMDSMLKLEEHADMDDTLAQAFIPATIDLIWSSTTSGRAIRMFVLDVYAEFFEPANLPTFVNDINPEFKEDLMLALVGNHEKPWLYTLGRNRCRYHEHDSHHPTCPPRPTPIDYGDTSRSPVDDWYYDSSDSVGFHSDSSA